MKIIIQSVVNAFLLIVVAYVVPGIAIESFFSAVVVFLLFTLVNMFIKPIIQILTLPINVLTLGIFGLIVNILLFWGISYFVPGFVVASFLSAAFGLVLYSLLQTTISRF